MYYACHMLPYGKEDQTLLIDDEPNKALWNPNQSGLFLESFKRQNLLKTKMQWWDMAFCLWSLLVELSFTNDIQIHYEVMVKYFKPHLNSSLKDYYWFLQYVDNDNGNVRNQLPPLGMHVLASFFFHFVNHLLIITIVQCYMFSYSTTVLYSLLFVIDLDHCSQNV